MLYQLYTYDNQGRVLTATDTENKTVTYSYNDLDNLTRTTFPDGTYSDTNYACCGLAAVTTHRNGTKTFYDYDPLKRLTRVQDAQGNSIEMKYDALNNLVQQIDTRGGITRWEYDTLNRVVKKTLPDGSFETYSYDLPGNDVSVTDAQGRTTTSYYDDNGNLLKIQHPNSATVSMQYDALNRPINMTDGLGTTTYQYDNLNRVSSIDGPWANDTETFHYDNLSRRDWMRLSNETGTGYDQTSYGYDSLGRMNSLTSAAGTFAPGYVGNTGKLDHVSLPNGTTTNYAYDNLNRLTQVQSVRNGSNSNVVKYAYGYETTGYVGRSVRTWMENQAGVNDATNNPLQHVDYSYDVVNQLTGESSTESPQPQLRRTYNYDAMGNRQTSTTQPGSNPLQSVSYSGNKLNQITNAETATSGSTTIGDSDYAFDPSGNLTQSVGSTTTGGSKVTVGTTQYSYDDLNRLTMIVQNTGSGVPYHKSEFVYDGLNRKRIAREYGWSGSSWVLQANGETRFIYDGMDVVQERDASNHALVTYTRGGNIGGLLARTVKASTPDNASASDKSYFYHYDGGGNVVALTNSSGNAVARYGYESYGNLQKSGLVWGDATLSDSTDLAQQAQPCQTACKTDPLDGV